jgi:TetR/AcrR family transcriptional repressor of nem operon
MPLDTRQLLMQEAEALMRTRGYAAFSYADLSERVGIRKASIHHHFPTKETLGAALIDSYLEKFEQALADTLTDEPTTAKRLERYAGFFVASIEDGMMPLCAALSAEAFALPQSLQQRVERFFNLHLEWLRGVVRDGLKNGELKPELDAKRSATLILSTLEGASLVAWALKDSSVIAPSIKDVVAALKA